MKVYCPLSPNYPLVRLTAVAGNWKSVSLHDQSHLNCQVDVPKHVDEDEVHVVAEFCNGRGEPQLPGITVKEATVKPKAQPKFQPKPEPKPEVKKEPEPEVKDETDKAEAKVEIKTPEVKVEVKPEAKPVWGGAKAH
jgi:outer membrane biosynthesis protein TonB